MIAPKIKSYYQVRFHKPGTNQAHVDPHHFETDIGATHAAKNNCPNGWCWTVFKLTPKVVASGPKELIHV